MVTAEGASDTRLNVDSLETLEKKDVRHLVQK